MKKSVFFLCFVVVAFGSFIFMSHTNVNEINNNILKTGGSSGGYTGSPGDLVTCTDCHNNDSDFNLTPTITTNIPTTGYILGQSYLITISTSSTGALGWGFELTAEEDTNNTKVGVFDLIGSTGSPILIGTTAVTNSNAISNIWSFNWTAPTTYSGAITFYAAVLAGNGSGKDGDQTVTTSYSTNSSTLNISEGNILKFNIYPNPSQDFLTILLPNDIENGEIELFDYSGKSAKSKQINSINNTLDIRNLPQGIYFVKLNCEDKTGLQKIIKK